MAEAASVSLDSQGHADECDLLVAGSVPARCCLRREEVTGKMRRTWADPEEATEFGATGIAILASRAFLKYQVIERSCKGTGFDYS